MSEIIKRLPADTPYKDDIYTFLSNPVSLIEIGRQEINSSTNCTIADISLFGTEYVEIGSIRKISHGKDMYGMVTGFKLSRKIVGKDNIKTTRTITVEIPR